MIMTMILMIFVVIGVVAARAGFGQPAVIKIELLSLAVFAVACRS